jgi:hypothetical protein
MPTLYKAVTYSPDYASNYAPRRLNKSTAKTQRVGVRLGNEQGLTLTPSGELTELQTPIVPYFDTEASNNKQILSFAQRFQS